MSSSSSSPLSGPSSPRIPSSSANTIPVVGRSILKRPPPPPQSLFSRISKFLPTQTQQQPGPEDEKKPLKRAHFILPEIAIVYPISSINPPSTPTLKDEKKAIEERELERRRRVLKSLTTTATGEEQEEWWPMEKVESFYRECCEGCDEHPDPAISAALKVCMGASAGSSMEADHEQHAAHTNPRTVDLSGVQLTFVKASILSDVFSIEWGLRKVVFRECDLDEHVRRPSPSLARRSHRAGPETHPAFTAYPWDAVVHLSRFQQAPQNPCVPSARCLSAEGGPIREFFGWRLTFSPAGQKLAVPGHLAEPNRQEVY
jgi:protein phosphatase 1 regulatory subunit 37